MDVVVVGAGITGAVAAYLFSDAGVRVALVEAGLAGKGSTSASTALLMQEPDRDLRELAAKYGRAAAREIWQALGRATAEFAATVTALKISCDFEECDSIYYTLERRKVPHLKLEFRERKRARLPGRWLSAAALQRLAGIPGQGAIVTPGNAAVNPVKACRGFIQAAVSRGAKVFERTRVRRIAHVRDGVVVHTERGQIRANQVVVATGYATREFKPLVGRFRLKDTFVIATRPVPFRKRRVLRGTRAMLWDTERPYHYARWTRDGRLLVGGADVNHRSGGVAARRLTRARVALREYLACLYPALAEHAPDYSWGGLFAETPDGLPYVGTHRRYPRHLFALGFGGNGMTASFLAAQLLLQRYCKRPDRRERLFAFNR